MQICVFLYLVLPLLHRIGHLMAYVAALLVAIFWGFQGSMAKWFVCQTQIARLQI